MGGQGRGGGEQGGAGGALTQLGRGMFALGGAELLGWWRGLGAGLATEG